MRSYLVTGGSGQLGQCFHAVTNQFSEINDFKHKYVESHRELTSHIDKKTTELRSFIQSVESN